jgi:rare lipoprotein A
MVDTKERQELLCVFKQDRMRRMEGRILSGDTVANQIHGSRGKIGKNNIPGVKDTPSSSKKLSVHTDSTVVLYSSFQEFMAEQTALLAARNTRRQDTPGSGTSPATALKPDASNEIVHTLRKGETIWGLAREQYKVDPAEILRLNGIDNPNNLRVGQQIRIPAWKDGSVADTSDKVVAGWYGEYHHGRFMANGERFDMNGATIAHRKIPIGTEVELENPKTGEKAKAMVTDRGPYHRGRDVDLSYGLAQRLSIAKQGVGNLKMRVL